MPSYGRGGAGNIQALATQQKELPKGQPKSPSDLEANRSPSLDDALASQIIADSRRAQSEQQGQQYAHTGRGGMGNFAESKELSKVPSVADDALRGLDSVNNALFGTYGRGGAGNREYREGQEARKENVARARRESLRAEVERDVEEGLAMPAKAKVVRRRGDLEPV